MNIVDWRSLDSARIAPLLETERRRWLTQLRWDYAANLADIERARISGQLPGYVALADDHCVGWSYHLLHRGTLQIGSIVAASADATKCLLDATLRSAEARAATAAMAFGFFDAPGIDRAFRDAKWFVGEYSYQQRDLNAAGSSSSSFECFDLALSSRMAGLLCEAYADDRTPRPFAPNGTSDEWQEYLAQLIHTTGCGAFDPGISVLNRQGDRLTAAALVTRIGPATVHLAQLVVDPSARGRGHGAAALDAASALAAKAGMKEMTLLVSASNVAAKQIYASRGFSARASFTLASRR